MRGESRLEVGTQEQNAGAAGYPKPTRRQLSDNAAAGGQVAGARLLAATRARLGRADLNERKTPGDEPSGLKGAYGVFLVVLIRMVRGPPRLPPPPPPPPHRHRRHHDAAVYSAFGAIFPVRLGIALRDIEEGLA